MRLLCIFALLSSTAFANVYHSFACTYIQDDSGAWMKDADASGDINSLDGTQEETNLEMFNSHPTADGMCWSVKGTSTPQKLDAIVTIVTGDHLSAGNPAKPLTCTFMGNNVQYHRAERILGYGESVFADGVSYFAGYANPVKFRALLYFPTLAEAADPSFTSIEACQAQLAKWPVP